MRIKFAILATAAALGLAACGDTVGEQAVFGGAAGGVGSAVLGGNAVAGAAVGAGANVLYCEANPSKC
ncbi:hypothetical protein [Tateyamaria sp. ANG-S1]|uniref:hypothetical protein n=1 Tax=Tateyamaria sp. ANG-S1 TaxID=1577905 RepID=UPI0005800107|nr:hypothetical protein [Tateyamaria sp. ANG-S1]KIC50796.1 hypothetical protein RA29_02415 [Tateyamaria sp. ANG-S1]